MATLSGSQFGVVICCNRTIYNLKSGSLTATITHISYSGVCVLIYPHPNMFKFKSKDTKKKKKVKKER